MRERDARVGRSGHGRSHAGHDLEFEPRFQKLFGLLGPAPENVRITALQAGHVLAFPDLGHDEIVDLVLGQGVVATLLADIDDLGVGTTQGQEALVRQVIVNDDLAFLQKTLPLDRDQARIAGTRADEICLGHDVSFGWQAIEKRRSAASAKNARPLICA